MSGLRGTLAPSCRDSVAPVREPVAGQVLPPRTAFGTALRATVLWFACHAVHS